MENNKTKWTPRPWETHVEWNVTGYPVFSIHGMSGDEKEDIVVLQRNAQLIAAAPDLYEAAVLQQECGLPVAELFYDEEAVEGWAWSHPDGRVWSVLGPHNELPPFHPVMEAALAKARGEN